MCRGARRPPTWVLIPRAADRRLKRLPSVPHRALARGMGKVMAVKCPACGEETGIPRCASCGAELPTAATDQMRDRAASDRDQVVSDRDQVVSDRDQTTSDQDQTWSDHDQTASER